MADPIVVEVTRGGRIESRHAGAIAVVDARGRVRAGVGDVEQDVYPRSAVKIVQALPLVETGAADAFGFTDRHLALALASHTGEPDHIAGVRAMLDAIGCAEDELECGPTWPRGREAALILANEGGAKARVQNTCSGKHAGMLAVARVTGASTKGYSRAEHPVQRRIAETMIELAGLNHGLAKPATDGCSLPTWPLPLHRFGLLMARLGVGAEMPETRAAAARRLMQAAFAEPYFVAGTEMLDTTIMRALPGLAFVKTGAEGVYAASLPQHGLGIAVKCADGATRASEVAVVAALTACLPDAADGLSAHLTRRLKNAAGIEVGEVRPASGLVEALKPSRA